MSPFRGTDETLDREIETLEGMAKRRLRRYTRDLRDLDRDPLLAPIARPRGRGQMLLTNFDNPNRLGNRY